jgi:hypothetical protein
MADAMIVAVRVTDSGGRRWWVGRRWLPWQPRMRGWGEPAGVDSGVHVDDVLSLVIVIVLLLPCLLFSLVLAVEWLIALALLPVLATIRLLLPVPWQVVARGRDAGGRRIRYAAPVRGWRASRQVIAGVAEEIRVHGMPRSLGAAVAEDADETPTELGGTVVVGHVHGLPSPFAVRGWLGGFLLRDAMGVALAQDPGGEVSRRAIPVPAGTPITVERGDDADRRVIGDCVVARFTGIDGRRYSLAVTPPRRASLEALLRDQQGDLDVGVEFAGSEPGADGGVAAADDE